MSTSVTQDSWEIVIYDQKELHTGLCYWAVDVWQDFDALDRAKFLWGDDNFDWDKYELTPDTLETLVAKAAEFIKGQQK